MLICNNCILIRIDDLYNKNEERYIVSPKSLLSEAVRQNDEIGSCTCVIVTLDDQADIIQTCNLGDSGYMILRREDEAPHQENPRILYESKEQQHSFNFPFQVGTNGDDPEKAEANAHKVEHGDILVVGSDGLWDNLHRGKIVDLVRGFTRGENHQIKDATLIAECLAKEAEKQSYLQHYMSPFAEGARAHGYAYSGGKPDDITVIVGQVELRKIIEGQK